MREAGQAHFLSDQAFALLGFAFAAFSPQLAILIALALSSEHSIPLPFRGLELLGVPIAFLTVLVLVVLDDVLVAAFVLAAVTRYEAIYALGVWPLRTVPTMFEKGDWSSKRAASLAEWENWFFNRPYRMLVVVIAMALFFGSTSGYLAWLAWTLV
jgi:hypothetical protein